MANPSRQISFPFRIGPDGGVAYSEDVVENVKNRLLTILRTVPGERVMLPGFGSSTWTFLFDNNDPVGLSELGVRLRAEISTWEPGVQIHDLSVTTPDVSSGEIDISLRFSVPPSQQVFSTLVTVGGSPIEVLRG